MQRSKRLPRFRWFIGFAILCWMALPERGGATPATWQPMESAVVDFLQNPGGPALGSSHPGAAFNHLPSSAMPFPVAGAACSVDTSDVGAPPRCSTATSAQRCSAHCDFGQRCSAFWSAAGANRPQCSTLGGTNSVCSVLQPPFGALNPSQCSSFGGPAGTLVECSVMLPGTRQICSAENPSNIAVNSCSAHAQVGGGGGIVRCSVLGGGNVNSNFCSVGLGAGFPQVSKQCSTFVVGGECSVLVGHRGRCTAFSGAPLGSCSAFGGVGHCSVIGGGAGVNCHWP